MSRTRKKTAILHYGAGVIAALVLFFLSVPIGMMLVFLFLVLEVWDDLKGHESWWDFQEFLVAVFIVSTLVLVLSAGVWLLSILGVL